MPNWCNNVVTIECKTKKALKRVIDAFNKGRLCDEFIPIPKALKDDRLSANQAIDKYGYSSWYEFCISEWGTKWDVGGDNGRIIHQSGKSVTLNFNSAWSPPIKFYEDLSSLFNYHVTAYYWEPGMGYAGKWTSEDGDDCYNLSGDYRTVRKELPKDIDETMGISESMEMWAEEE